MGADDDGPHRVRVTAERDYEVLIGRDLIRGVPELLGPAGRVAIVHPPVLSGRARELATCISDTARQPVLIEVPEAEQAKTMDVLGSCWTRLGEAGFTRSDAVIGLGGGSVTDLSGFLAATWMRGITSVLVPTTALGMVDAAIGGKTGINSPAGKNLIGAFHSPAAVVCDVDLLRSLPPADLVAGIAEVVKVGFTSDPRILHQIRTDPAGCLDPEGPLIGQLIRRAVQVKAVVVGADFREQASDRTIGEIGREVLNYGHTFGHAVEHVEGYRWRHGAAVAVGLGYVAELARIGGYLPDADADTHREVLGLIGLPTSYPKGRWTDLRAAMSMDKKARGELIRFVILSRIGEPMGLNGPSESLMRAAYDAIAV